MHWLYLFVAISFEVAGTSALKLTEGFTKLVPSLITAMAYAVSFFMLSLSLKAIPVGMAYAIWSGVGVAAIAIIGWLVFKQTLDMAGIIGIGLIMAGVVVLKVFSKTGA